LEYAKIDAGTEVSGSVTCKQDTTLENFTLINVRLQTRGAIGFSQVIANGLFGCSPSYTGEKVTDIALSPALLANATIGNATFSALIVVRNDGGLTGSQCLPFTELLQWPSKRRRLEYKTTFANPAYDYSFKIEQTFVCPTAPSFVPGVFCGFTKEVCEPIGSPEKLPPI